MQIIKIFKHYYLTLLILFFIVHPCKAWKSLSSGIAPAGSRAYIIVIATVQIHKAQELSSLFKKQGYRCYEFFGSDAKYDSVMNAFKSISQLVNRRTHDRIIFYFCGHAGAGNTKNPNFFKMILHKDELRWIDTKQFLEESRVMYTAVFIDACSSGLVANNEFQNFPVCNPIDNKGAALTITTWDKEVEAGVFTPTIIKGLRGKADTSTSGYGKGIVDIMEMKAFMEKTITNINYISPDGIKDTSIKYTCHAEINGDGNFNLLRCSH